MSEEILKKLKEHDERFDRHDKKFEEIDRRFDHIDQQLDLLARKSVEHDADIQWMKENMATKDDIRGIADSVDTLVRLHQKKDQELAMMAHGMRRHEDRLEKVEGDVKQIKPLLGLSS